MRRLARTFPFAFRGRTKKIVCAAGLDGARVVPTQAMTATVHSVLAPIGPWLFSSGRPARVIPVALTISQIRRVYSETPRCCTCKEYGWLRFCPWDAVPRLGPNCDSTRARVDVILASGQFR